MPKKPYTGRDPLMVRLINGATKAAVHVDKKKATNKEQCRKPIRRDPTKGTP